MDELITKKFKYMKELMEKIAISFDECSEIAGMELYPSTTMLTFLAQAETALESVLFSLKREIGGIKEEKEKMGTSETEYAEKMEALGSRAYIR